MAWNVSQSGRFVAGPFSKQPLCPSMSHPFQGFDAVTSKVRKRTLTKVAWSVAGYRIHALARPVLRQFFFVCEFWRFAVASLALLNNSVLQVISLDSNNLGLEGAKAMSFPRSLAEGVSMFFMLKLYCLDLRVLLTLRNCTFMLFSTPKKWETQMPQNNKLFFMLPVAFIRRAEYLHMLSRHQADSTPVTM